MLNRIIGEVRTCIEHNCFIAALSLALTLPDICGKAEYPNEGNTSRYIKWFNEYIGKYESHFDDCNDDMPYISGELIYNLRNSILHQGNPNIEAKKIKEDRCKVNQFILSISDFTDGGLQMVSYGKNNIIVERMITINMVNLCWKLCRAAKKYYQGNTQKFNFFNYQIEYERNDIDDIFDINDIDRWDD